MQDKQHLCLCCLNLWSATPLKAWPIHSFLPWKSHLSSFYQTLGMKCHTDIFLFPRCCFQTSKTLPSFRICLSPPLPTPNYVVLPSYEFIATFLYNSHNSVLFLFFILFHLQSNAYYIQIDNTVDHFTSQLIDLQLHSYQKRKKARLSALDLYAFLP